MELKNIIVEYIKNNEKLNINYIETINFIKELLKEIEEEINGVLNDNR